jgi:sec-independent protein translocase protein TatA
MGNLQEIFLRRALFYKKGKQMGTFSAGHWLVVLVIVLLLFGAKKIPELAKGLGSGIKNFKDELKKGEEEEKEAVQATVSTPEEKPTVVATTVTEEKPATTEQKA